jgi:hypothetical protein
LREERFIHLSNTPTVTLSQDFEGWPEVDSDSVAALVGLALVASAVGATVLAVLVAVREPEDSLTIEGAQAIGQQDWESEIRLLAGENSPVDQFGLLPVPDEQEAP